MALVIRKFSSLTDLNAFIGGRLRGSVNLQKVHSSLYLHGLTLIFATPSKTVTFAASPTAAQVPLTLKQIKDQIEAQTTSLVAVNYRDGQLELHTVTPGALVLDKAGTANAKLGFGDNVNMTVAPVNAPSGSTPKFVSLVSDPGSNSYTLVMETA